jgi:DnaK suppressor protein
MNKKDTEELKEKLKQSKESVTKQLETFAVQDENLKHNWNTQFPNKEKGNKEEEAEDANEFEQLLSLEHSLELKLKDVNIALEKIEKGKNGKYGICERCGEKIEEKRLSACPEAKLCVKCNEDNV